MVTSAKGLGPEKDYAGEDQQPIKRQTRPLVIEGAPEKQDSKVSKSNKHLVMSPRWGSTPRLTD
jgi:hypothetical protein